MVLYIITGSVNTPHKVRRECLHVHKQDGQIKHVVYVLFTAYCKVGKECSVHIKKFSSRALTKNLCNIDEIMITYFGF